MDLNNRVAVVTGAASGIGACCARAFAAQGAKVVAADLNGDGANEIAQEIGGLAVACDVGNEQDINNLVEKTEKELGPVDIFFSNAAVATGGNPLDTPIAVWQQQWEINVMAHVYAVRAVLPGMLDREEGYLIHTASMAGILTSQGNLTYATTKHAVVGLAEWLSISYHDKGVRTSLLAPLGVNTPMLGGTDSKFARTAAGPVKEPEDVANMVVDAVQEERFLRLTDEIAQTWMERKTNDLERWLNGMRRLQGKMDSMS